MKNTIKIFIITLVLSFTTLAQSLQTIELNDSSIKVPAKWKVSSTDGANKVINIMVVNKKGLSSGENINFTSTDIGIDIDDSIVEISLGSTLAILEDAYDKVTLIEQGKNYIIISAEVQGLNMKQKLVMHYKGSVIYYLAFTAFENTYATYEREYEEVEASFEIK